MSITGAIFDADGTLLDSMFIWDTVGEDYLRSIGYEPEEDLNEKFRNMSLYQAACYYRNEYGVRLSTVEITEGVNKMIGHYYRDTVKLKKGVAGFLGQLREKGVRMCIATATDRHLIEAALRRNGIFKYFSDIYTCTAVGHGKDEPFIYREAQHHLKSEKSETVIFEDALFAIKTAKNDGFITAGVYDIHENNQAEVEELSDFYMTNFSDFNSFWQFAQ